MVSKKKAAKKPVSSAQRKKIQTALQGIEKKLVSNYQGVAKMSGKDWKKQTQT